MIRSERRLLVDTGILGVLLTGVVVALGWAGGLAAMERFFYDLRARHCHFFTPPPTDKLVHLDIDDRTLEAVGAWPWPRSKLAELVDEINRAGCKALAMDVLFSEPQPPGYEPVKRGMSFEATTQPVAAGETVAARAVDHDGALAASLRAYGRAVVPLSLTFSVQQSKSPIYRPMVMELFKDLELGREALIGRMQNKGVSDAEAPGEVNRLFLAAREEAMYERLVAEAGSGEVKLEDLQRKLLPRMDVRIQEGSPLRRLLVGQYERYRSVRSLRRFARPMVMELPPLVSTRDEQATLRAFSEVAGSTGYVDYIPAADGVVRSVPLWAIHRDWMFPQMGLALACAALDVKLKDVVVRADAVVLPRKDGDIVIPVRREQTPRGRFGLFFDIPWFGGASWEMMYDYPKHEDPKQHISLAAVWDACAVRHRMAQNNRAMDEAVANLLAAKDPEHEYRVGLSPMRAKRYFEELPDVYEMKGRKEMAELTLRLPGVVNFLKATADPNDPNAVFMHDMAAQAKKALENGLRDNEGLAEDLEARRAELRGKLVGRAALMGWTAAGSLADVVPTSLHPRCPGVVVHGVIFNSIVTGHFWHRAPGWVTSLITVGMGLLMTAIVARLSPWKALAATVVLAGGYLAFNGVYLFDKHNWLVGVAEPIVAAGMVWAGGTLARYILEASLRAKIKRRFESYVDPTLVNFVMESDAPLDGQVKELTVVFTDLGGFTAMTERLGERTVGLLNKYMGLMVPVIRGRKGYLNKFLGDGIMYFFGAPAANEYHAYDAVASVLEMLEVMGPFNESLVGQGLPRLEVRAGIASGDMVVGDAGPEDRSASDYTVLGDRVNLGARLEPANKVFGTKILMNARARELVGDRVLVRPIGKIQVVGKVEGVMVYEALSLMEKATEDQKSVAELTGSMVKAFMEGDFAGCLEAVERMEAVIGQSKLTLLYRGLCERYVREGKEAGFDGQIVLTAK